MTPRKYVDELVRITKRWGKTSAHFTSEHGPREGTTQRRRR
jgi:hypothetical protein